MTGHERIVFGNSFKTYPAWLMGGPVSSTDRKDGNSLWLEGPELFFASPVDTTRGASLRDDDFAQ